MLNGFPKVMQRRDLGLETVPSAVLSPLPQTASLTRGFHAPSNRERENQKQWASIKGNGKFYIPKETGGF